MFPPLYAFHVTRIITMETLQCGKVSGKCTFSPGGRDSLANSRGAKTKLS